MKRPIWLIMGIVSVCLGTVAAMASPPGSPRPEVQKNFKKLVQTRSCVNCDLAGINLVRADLKGVNLMGANLAGARLNLADLSGANLVNANLQGAELGGADLAGADLRGANLTGAIIEGAYMKGALMEGQVVTRQPFKDEGLGEVEEKVFVQDEAKSKPAPYTGELTVKQRKDFEETPPVVPQSSAEGQLEAGKSAPSLSRPVRSSVDQEEGTVASKKVPRFADAVVPADSATAVLRTTEKTTSEARAAAGEKEHVSEEARKAASPQSGQKKTRMEATAERPRQLVAPDSEVGAVIRDIEMDQQPVTEEQVLIEQHADTAPPKAVEAAGGHETSVRETTPATVTNVDVSAETGDAETRQEQQPAPPQSEAVTADSGSPAGEDGGAPAVEGAQEQADGPVEAVGATVRSGLDTVLGMFSSAPASQDPRKQKLVEQLLDSDRCPECDLGGVSLRGKDLEDADLERASLRKADLEETDLRHANLKGVDFTGANLRDADLREADLYQARFSGADLTGARLEGALIDSADFTGATGANLEKAVGAAAAE